ncbi:MAG: hypothetical protein AAB691_00050 [Patescibacteria group bacterium]
MEVFELTEVVGEESPFRSWGLIIFLSLLVPLAGYAVYEGVAHLVLIWGSPGDQKYFAGGGVFFAIFVFFGLMGTIRRDFRKPPRPRKKKRSSP